MTSIGRSLSPSPTISWSFVYAEKLTLMLLRFVNNHFLIAATVSIFLCVCIRELKHNEVWQIQWFASLFLASAWMSYIVGKRIHWTAGLAYSSVLLSSILVIATTSHPWSKFYLTSVFAIKKVVGLTTISFLFLTIPLLFAKRWHIDQIKTILSLACIANVTFSLIQFVLGRRNIYTGGFIGVAGMSACFNAVIYPILVYHDNPGSNYSSWYRKAWAFYCVF